MKDVVPVGAGHAHVGVLRAFGRRPLPGVRLTLVTREFDIPYSGMLPGLIAGHYGFEETRIDTGPSRVSRAIDRRFMARFNQLPGMAPPISPGRSM